MSCMREGKRERKERKLHMNWYFVVVVSTTLLFNPTFQFYLLTWDVCIMETFKSFVFFTPQYCFNKVLATHSMFYSIAYRWSFFFNTVSLSCLFLLTKLLQSSIYHWIINNSRKAFSFNSTRYTFWYFFFFHLKLTVCECEVFPL